MLLGNDFLKEQNKLLRNRVLTKKEKKELIKEKGKKEIAILNMLFSINGTVLEPCFLIEKDENFSKNIRKLKRLIKKENTSNDDIIYIENFKNIETFIYKNFKMIKIEKINIF